MDGQITTALWRRHAGRLAVGIACLVGLAVATAAYAYLAGPVVELILTGATRGPGLMLRHLPVLPRLGGAAPLLWFVAVLLLALALLKGLCQLGAALLLDGTAERIGTELRQHLYGHLLKLPLSSHRQQSTGDLLIRLVDDVRHAQEALLAAPLSLAREGLAALGLAAVAVGTAPGLALLALLAVPLAGLLIGALGRAVRRAAFEAQTQLGALSARATQGLAAIREVKSCGAEERELGRVGRHASESLRWTLHYLRARALAPLANEIIAAVGLGAVLIYAGDRVARGLLAPERFLSFFTALLLLYRPLKEIGRAFHQRAAGRASLERIHAVLEQQPEPAPADAIELPSLRRSFALQGVWFAFGGAATPVLAELALELPVGRVVAVTGQSGAGKSTLVNIICGLEQPASGRVLWDGEEVGGDPRRLRRAVALVPQQPLMLDGTIEENLRYGAPDAEQAQVEQALCEAALAERVGQLRDGVATRLGAGGIQLSVGEAQRLALARALLRATSLVVLDEPASALDRGNEDQLVATVRGVASAGRAVLLVAHSPRLLAAADEVWELHDGRLTLLAPSR